MLIPLSWLKEYVDIKIPFPKLAQRLSEAGLTVETWKETDNDIIFDPEITPNRPDWMSVYGVAREVAAVTGSRIKDQELKIPTKDQKVKNSLPITIKPNYELVPRITSVLIKNVKVKPSPDWLQKKIKQVGLRPINNLVDITNYVLWTYGSLLHVFDYDKIRGHQMEITSAHGGEPFRSLDGISYILPKDAIIIKDVGRIIDLLPIKGGENTAAGAQTKNVLLHSVVVDPVLTRRTSQFLGLRSDSSAIAERGLDPNGTVRAVSHALALVLELAGGEVASQIIDHKKEEFKPWTVEMNHDRLEKILGIKIGPKRVTEIFERLELSTTYKANNAYSVTVPTFRNDLHIEEDLIEEVGRIHGYNNFPKTLPASPVPTTPVAYTRDYDFEYQVKQTLKGAGYNEIYTYSLVSEDQLIKLAIDPTKCLRVDNPISRDFEYLRPNLLGNLLDAYKINQPNFPNIKIYELGKRYLGKTIDEGSEEYWLWLAASGEKTLELKGLAQHLLTAFGVFYRLRPATEKDAHHWFHPGRVAQIDDKDGKYLGVLGELHPRLLSRWGIKGRVSALGLNYDLFEKEINPQRKYHSVPKYPPVVEDLSLVLPGKVLYGDTVEVIQKSSSLVSSVDLLDTHEESITLRLTYLDPTRNLTEKEVNEIRKKILANLKEKLGVKGKD